MRHLGLEPQSAPVTELLFGLSCIQGCSLVDNTVRYHPARLRRLRNYLALLHQVTGISGLDRVNIVDYSLHSVSTGGSIDTSYRIGAGGRAFAEDHLGVLAYTRGSPLVQEWGTYPIGPQLFRQALHSRIDWPVIRVGGQLSRYRVSMGSQLSHVIGVGVGHRVLDVGFQQRSYIPSLESDMELASILSGLNPLRVAAPQYGLSVFPSTSYLLGANALALPQVLSGPQRMRVVAEHFIEENLRTVNQPGGGANETDVSSDYCGCIILPVLIGNQHAALTQQLQAAA